MNVYLIALTLISVANGATITNNNFGLPGQTITNNNDAFGDEVIINNNTPGGRFRFHSHGSQSVFQEKNCPFGTITNNNQGSVEVVCSPPGLGNVINNNN